MKNKIRRILLLFLALIIGSCSFNWNRFKTDDKFYYERYYKIYGDCLGDSLNFNIDNDLLELGWVQSDSLNIKKYPRVTYKKYYINTIGKETSMNWRFEWTHYRWLNVKVAFSESQFKRFMNGKKTKEDSLYWEVRDVLEKYCLLKDTLIVTKYQMSSPLE